MGGFADIVRMLQHQDLDWAFIEWFLRGEGLERVGDSALAGRIAFLPRANAAVGDAASPGRDGAPIARLMRRRIEAEPLWLDVQGRSMGWSIRDGDRVRIESAASPRRGDVWAFCTANGDIVVHRYRGGTSGTRRFHGDARSRPDDLVTDDQLIGRVVEIASAPHPLRWGPTAGSIQRVPRVAVRAVTRAVRRARSLVVR